MKRLPAGVSVLPADTLKAFQLSGAAPNIADVETVAASGMPTKSLYVRTLKQPDQVYSIQLTAHTVAPVACF